MTVEDSTDLRFPFGGHDKVNHSGERGSVDDLCNIAMEAVRECLRAHIAQGRLDRLMTKTEFRGEKVPDVIMAIAMASLVIEKINQYEQKGNK